MATDVRDILDVKPSEAPRPAKKQKTSIRRPGTSNLRNLIKEH